MIGKLYLIQIDDIVEFRGRAAYNIKVHGVGEGGMLGKLPVPVRPTIWITVGQGPTALAVGAGGGCLNIFTLHPFSPLSSSLWETARYRLKYCLKGPLNPKQPTNQPQVHLKTIKFSKFAVHPSHYNNRWILQVRPFNMCFSKVQRTLLSLT